MEIGTKAVVFYTDDVVWHERIVLLPGHDPNVYWVLTPDEDIYEEDLGGKAQMMQLAVAGKSTAELNTRTGEMRIALARASTTADARWQHTGSRRQRSHKATTPSLLAKGQYSPLKRNS